ncbi:MAG: hypothetical protein ACRC0X_09115 [Brevinema sp.]
MKFFYLLLLILTPLSAQSHNQAYEMLQGIWSAHNELEEQIDIIFNIDSTGQYELSLITIDEDTDIEQQSTMIQQYIPTQGYFKIIETLSNSTEQILVQTEILLNEEISTNLLEINVSNVYIINDNIKELFLKR